MSYRGTSKPYVRQRDCNAWRKHDMGVHSVAARWYAINPGAKTTASHALYACVGRGTREHKAKRMQRSAVMLFDLTRVGTQPRTWHQSHFAGWVFDWSPDSGPSVMFVCVSGRMIFATCRNATCCCGGWIFGMLPMCVAHVGSVGSVGSITYRGFEIIRRLFHNVIELVICPNEHSSMLELCDLCVVIIQILVWNDNRVSSPIYVMLVLYSKTYYDILCLYHHPTSLPFFIPQIPLAGAASMNCTFNCSI